MFVLRRRIRVFDFASALAVTGVTEKALSY